MHYETSGGLKPEFVDGVRNFIEHTMILDSYMNNGLIRCPYSGCRYFVWVDHEERDGLNGMFYNSIPMDEYNMFAAYD
ncbi:hypothetical protein H5410_002248 [Solanum commersonii]|uniref:Transposase-associated domain-containing protein n=1 Tax=Solanum commersonii TaxID=4109 RepID=A0A9J6B1U2_SOLCO|nr:hypothetical protein H5410_002248 [Solanum commersonii]